MSVKDTLESHSQDRPTEIKILWWDILIAGQFCHWWFTQYGNILPQFWVGSAIPLPRRRYGGTNWKTNK